MMPINVDLEERPFLEVGTEAVNSLRLSMKEDMKTCLNKDGISVGVREGGCGMG